MTWWYSTGKKKSAIAKVYIKPEGDSMIINNKKIEEYFPKNLQYNILLYPLKLTNTKFLIKVKVKGGGFMGQIQAIKSGLAKAIFKYDKKYKAILSEKKLLSNDSRKVERKKIGKKKARKNKQFSKR